MKPLAGKVAVVAGATRGVGRGIACALGEAGATVYCTGRSTRAKKVLPRGRGKLAVFDYATRRETIEETAEMVSARGGVGIYAQVDHTVEEQVKALFKRVGKEQGRLDILVNDVPGGDILAEWKPFWKHNLRNGLLALERSAHTHIIATHCAAPLLIKTGGGLVVEITDGDGYYYRGNFFYDLIKTTLIRLAFDVARELRKFKITSLAVTPGFIRSEAMLDYFGVTEANWRDAVKKRPEFIESETPVYVGRAVAALAADPQVFKKTGRVFSSWDLAQEYDLKDVDGRQPNMYRWLGENMPNFKWRKCDDEFYRYWIEPDLSPEEIEEALKETPPERQCVA